MLNKIFPLTNYENIKYDTEGLYSITNYIEADTISKIIIDLFDSNKELKIMDGTGGIGGNTISFCKYFKKVTTLEIDSNRFNMLKNNIDLYDFKNIDLINQNSIKYLFENYNKYDIFFFDPPWGGHDYKKLSNITLKMDNMYLHEIIDKIIEKTNNKIFIFKLPFNYNFEEFNLYNYKLFKINKYYIIMILI